MAESPLSFAEASAAPPTKAIKAKVMNKKKIFFNFYLLS